MKIYVAGHRGMVGSALCRALDGKPDVDIVTKSSSELDLTNQSAVRDFLSDEKPDRVILSAAKVGGISSNNTFPAQFIYENLMMECNVIHESYCAGVKSLLQLGSSCIYPKNIDQPINENKLLTGPLEATNEPYAIAKIAGIKLCESYNRQYGTDFRSIMPTNLYGPGDNFHPENSHVLPAMIQRFHSAKISKSEQVVIWGSGKPMREFLHVDDMADAALHVMDLPENIYNANISPMSSHINVGSGVDVTILHLAELVASVVNFKGQIVTNENKPDGTFRKLMDSSLINRLGWRPSIDLEEGISDTYQWFLENSNKLRAV